MLKDLFNLLCKEGASMNFIQEPTEDGKDFENVAVILVGGLEITVKNAQSSTMDSDDAVLEFLANLTTGAEDANCCGEKKI